MNKEIKQGYSFDEKRHRHLWGDKSLTGVTTVLAVISKGDGLIQWSANEAVKWLQANPTDFDGAKVAWKKTRDNAGDAGVDIHSEIEKLIKNAIEKTDGVIIKSHNNPQIQKFIEWARDIKFLSSEVHIWSVPWFVGGIADFVYEKNGKIYVGDIKTAKAIYPINFFQTGAYAKMLMEQKFHNKIYGTTVVRLGKGDDKSFEVLHNYDVENNIKCFEHILAIYRQLNAIS